MKRYLDIANKFKEDERFPSLPSLIDTSSSRTVQAVTYLNNIEYSNPNENLSHQNETNNSFQEKKYTLTSPSLSPKRTRRVPRSTASTIINTKYCERKLKLLNTSVHRNNKKAASYNDFTIPSITSPKRKTYQIKKKTKKKPVSLMIASPTRFKKEIAVSPIKGLLKMKCENIMKSCNLEMKDIHQYNAPKDPEKAFEEKINKKFQQKNIVNFENFKRDVEELEEKNENDLNLMPSIYLFNTNKKLIEHCEYASKMDTNLAYNARRVISDLFQVDDNEERKNSSIRDEKLMVKSKKKISQMEKLLNKNVNANNRCKYSLNKFTTKSL